MRFKKVLKISAIVLVVLIGIAVALPFVFKNKLIQMAKEQVNEQINATVDFQEADLRFIRTFPDFTLVFQEFTVEGEGAFEGKRLADIGTLQLTLDIMTVIRGETIQIKKILADRADIRLYILESGAANWDIVKSEEEVAGAEEEEPYDMAVLEFYEITNGSLSYEDYTMNMFVDARGVNHSGTGDFASNIFLLHTETKMDTLNFLYDNMQYLYDVNADADVDIEINLDESTYTFRDNEIRINELYAAMDGYVSMPEDDVVMDLNFKSTRTDFKTVLSFVPAIYMKDFESIQTSGNVAMEGYLKGTYSSAQNLMPGFNVQLTVDNGRMQYPDLPKSLEKVSFDLSIKSEGKQEYDDMVIQMTKGYLEVAGFPIQGNFILRTPFSDPDIDAAFKGNMDLSTIQDVMPLEEGSFYSGHVSADVQLDGRMSAIEQKRYKDFDASGSFVVEDMEYKSADLPYDVLVEKMLFNVSPQFLKLTESNMQFGSSDIAATGQIDNYLDYIFGEEVIKGSFDIYSRKFDMNELMSLVPEDTTQAASAEMSVIELPGNVDFKLNARADEVLYDNLNIKNVRGDIFLKDKVASIQGLQMDLLDGKVTMDGSYNVQDKYKPVVEFDFDIKDMDINEAANKFNTVAILAPIAERTTGRFSTGMSFNSLLDQNMSPDLSTVLSKGRLKASDIFIEGFEPLNELAKRLNISRLAKQRIEDLLVYFRIEDGKVNVDPYEVMLGNTNATIAGYTTLEQELFYIVNLKIPRTEFGNKANNVLNDLLNEVEKRGIKMDQLDYLLADVIIEGTIKAPRLSFKLSDENKDIVSSLKDQVEKVVRDKVDEGKKIVENKVEEVKDQVEDKIDETKEKAQAELNARADQVIKEAERQAASIRSEAKSAADRIRSESENQAVKLEEEATNPLRKAAAKLAADRIRKEGNKNADRLEKEADERVNKLLEEAKSQADRIRQGEE